MRLTLEEMRALYNNRGWPGPASHPLYPDRFTSGHDLIRYHELTEDDVRVAKDMRAARNLKND